MNQVISAMAIPTIFVAGLMCVPACEQAEQPAYFRIAKLYGTPYERGFQHGSMFPSEIRRLYTTMLTSSLLPYLNRERPDIASVLAEYNKDLYADGQFSYQLMLESAKSMEAYMPSEFIEEMKGIADGAGLTYEKVLILNTFLDSMLTLRSITFFIRRMEAPYVAWVEFEGLDDDGADNDGDGEVDEAGEGHIEPYEPLTHAALVEVPRDVTVRYMLVDQAGAKAVLGIDPSVVPEGVDPDTVRIQIDTEVVTSSDPQITTRAVTHDDQVAVEVTLRRDGGFPPESTVSLLLQAGDLSWITDPLPAHARFMRDERITFTTAGCGSLPREVENRGENDGRTLPPSIGFAARNSATTTGETLMAHHYTLLDANTSHKHTAMFVHHGDDGYKHVVLGHTGLIGGFSGMNSAGLSFGVFSSDTLDNGMVEDIVNNMLNISQARLLTTGVPMGMMGRAVLSRAATVDEAALVLGEYQPAFGWNMLFADAEGGMLAVEMDSDIRDEGGLYSYSVNDNSDDPTSMASVGPDDLRLSCHFVANTQDMQMLFIRPQRYWSSFYFRSMKAYYILGEQIDISYGGLDVAKMIEIMRHPDLVDPRDSMSAVVFENTAGRLHVSMGVMPATDGEFQQFDLDQLFARGRDQ